MRGLRVALLAGLVAGGIVGCEDEEAKPVAAARAFAEAVASRNVSRVMPLVSKEAVTRLELAAERASNQVGGRRTIAPEEMLQIVDLDPTFQVGEARLVSASAETAQVELVDAAGETHLLHLVYEDQAWRVRVPLPAAKERTR